MAAVAFFTLNSTASAISADESGDGLPDVVGIDGYCDVFPRIATGKALLSPTLDTPGVLLLKPVRGQFVDGVLRPVHGINEVQTVTVTGSPVSGTFTLTFAGQTTSAIALGATAQVVQAALVALSNVNIGDLTVSGADGGPYTVTFGGDLAGLNVAQMTATPSFTGGTAPGVTVATTRSGDPGTGIKLVACTSVIPLGNLIYDLVFSGNHIGDSPVIIAPFAFAAPTSGGGSVDLASVTRLAPLPNLQPLS